MVIDLSKRQTTAEVTKSKAGKQVTLAGWVKEVRDIGKLAFIILRDRDGEAQLVALKKDLKNFDEVKSLSRESAIAVKGKTQAGKSKDFKQEIVISELEILSRAEALPIDPSGDIKTNLDKRLDWRCVDLRNPKHAAVFTVQSKIVEGVVEWLSANGFRIVFTPCLMGVPSESGAEMFEIPFFGKTAFLRQDPQLHRQLTIAGGIERIADIGPSWRAEKSHTIRHLCEHRTIAVEFAFLKDEHDTMRVEEQIVVAAFKKVKEDCKRELELLGVKVDIPKTPFPELTFPEIYKILEKAGKKIEYGEDIDMECEKILAEHVKQKYKHDFFFLNHFPFKKKPFYVMKLDDTWARSVDMIFRGMEMSSGGQRENRYEQLMQNVEEKKMSAQSVEWFTQFFKFGVPPHGGFAMGIERLTQQLLGLENVREAVLFPRDTERLVP